MKFGLHVSVAGGVHLAIERARSMCCDCFQIFVANPRSWQSKPVTEEEGARFRELRQEAGIGPVIVHLTYLPNLAARDTSIRKKSLQAFFSQYEDAARIGADLFVLHPGSAKDSSRKEAIGRLADALSNALDQVPKGPLLLPENMAGGGSLLGATPEELAEIDHAVGVPERMGTCFDTAHAAAAGLSLDTRGSMGALRRRYRQSFGRHPIQMVHLNDLRSEPGSRHDRHDHIGKGNLGTEAIRNILATPGMRRLPIVLETPVDEACGDSENLAAARRLSLDSKAGHPRK